MHVNDGGYNAEAVTMLADRDYAAAGDTYARAAWSVLAEPRDGLDTFDVGERGYVGTALQEMLLSAVCYAVAGGSGGDERAERRCDEGVAVSEDLAARAAPPQEACLREFAADFRAVAGTGAGEAYDEAAEAYESAAPGIGTGTEDPASLSTTPLYRAAAAPVKQMARSIDNGEIAVDWDDLHGSDPSDPAGFLRHRVRYKRKRLKTLFDGVVEDGYLAAPRGTTEYSNDNHRCPECGSEDVNWVADSVLCLRCSSHMAEK